MSDSRQRYSQPRSQAPAWERTAPRLLPRRSATRSPIASPSQRRVPRGHFVLGLLTIAIASAVVAPDPSPQTGGGSAGVAVRCAVIGGMTDTGLWTEVGKRFEKKTGHTIEIVAQGNKRVIAPLFETWIVPCRETHFVQS